MANFVNKIKGMGFWNTPEDEMGYDEYEGDSDYSEESFDTSFDAFDDAEDFSSTKSSSYSKRPSVSKVVNISATAKLQVVLFKPANFGDETRSIANELLKSHTVVPNLEDANGEVSRRTIDFLSGVAFANRGQIKRIATKTFIILPHNVDLTGDDLLDELESNGVYF